MNLLRCNLPVSGDRQSPAKFKPFRLTGTGIFPGTFGDRPSDRPCWHMLPICDVGRIVGYVVAMLSVVLGANRNVQAEAPVPITCAVISDRTFDSRSLTFVDLLEARLSESPELNVLSRSKLEKITAEHALGLALGSDTNESRKRAGQILRAEMLVMLHIRKVNSESVIDIEISETRQGLRLSNITLMWKGDWEPLAKTIVSRTHLSARTARAGSKSVIAVPPFESGDFDYESAHLKNGLALVAESTLAAVPGVLVADLNNCEKLAREIAISQGTEYIQRAFPFYVTGRFETKGLREDRKIDLQLDLTHGRQFLVSVTTNGLSAAAVAPFIRSSVRQFAMAMTGEHRLDHMADVDAEAEADFLEQRLNAFRATGEWEQVIQLAEAGLLLDPQRTFLRWRAFEAIHHFYVDDHSKDYELQRPLSILRSLEQLEAYLRNPDERVELSSSRMTSFFQHTEISYKSRWQKVDEPVKQLYRECRRAKWRTLRTILKYPPQCGGRNPESGQARFLRSVVGYGAGTILRGAQSEHYPKTANENVTAILVGLDGRFALPELWRIIYGSRRRVENYEALLSTIEQSSAKDARLVLKMRKIIEERKARGDVATLVDDVGALLKSEGRQPREITKILGNVGRQIHGSLPNTGLDTDGPFVLGDIRFTPLSIPLDSKAENSVLKSWRTFDSDFELLVFGTKYYVMRQPYKLEPCPALDSLGVADDVVWDGRHLWFAGKSATQPLTVFDPYSKSIVARVSKNDGLPSAVWGCKLAPLSVGKVFVAGAFGRSWLATVTLPQSPSDGIEVNVLHRSKEAAEAISDAEPQSPNIAFRPNQVIAIPRGENLTPWIIVRRNLWPVNYETPPLLVDLVVDKISVLPDQWWGSEWATIEGDTVYLWNLLRLREPGRTVAVASCEAPDFRLTCKPGLVFERVLYNNEAWGGGLAAYSLRIGQKVHLIRGKWVTLDLERGEMERCLDLPKLWWWGRLVNSQFHGLVRYGMLAEPKGPLQVSFVSEDDKASPESPRQHKTQK